MRAAESLILGSVMLKPNPGSVHCTKTGEDYGCAIGMIAAGSGHLESLRCGRYQIPTWMLKKLTEYPCSCCSTTRGPGSTQNAVGSIIVHLFDFHVFGARDWTIEKIADWLEPVEPRELDVVKISDMEAVCVQAKR